MRKFAILKWRSLVPGSTHGRQSKKYRSRSRLIVNPYANNYNPSARTLSSLNFRASLDLFAASLFLFRRSKYLPSFCSSGIAFFSPRCLLNNAEWELLSSLDNDDLRLGFIAGAYKGTPGWRRRGTQLSSTRTFVKLLVSVRVHSRTSKSDSFSRPLIEGFFLKS